MTREITVEAKLESIAAVTEFVDELMDAVRCPLRARMQLDIAIDELLCNVARYAYGPDGGSVTVRAETNARAAALTFIDRGAPFNPLEREDPDVSLSAEQRPIGGLGIFVVKKNMDEIQYSYENGENRLRVVKKW